MPETASKMPRLPPNVGYCDRQSKKMEFSQACGDAVVPFGPRDVM